MEKLNYYWNRLKQHPVAYNLVQIVGIILILAIAAHILMMIGTRHNAHRTVPDLTGISIEDATHLADKTDLTLLVNDSLYVPAYEGGIILDQLPESGVEVKPGRTVYVTINSFQQKMVPIPYVAGRSLRQAKNMLEIAGLEIAELVYRPDMATNYVLEEFYKGRPISSSSRIEGEVGSGVTLYVGVEGGRNITAMPRLIGLPLKEAQSRIWEQGLNVGKVEFDEGINRLNQREARVYVQVPGPERGMALGAKVDLKLTLEHDKIGKFREQAEKQAKANAAERMQAERLLADSLAQTGIDPEAAGETKDTETESNDNDGFF